jgi:IS605 OrfB family transposase
MARDGTQRAILDRLLDGSYRLGQSQMTYEQKKWFLSLTYKFVPEVRELDKSKILGVDLGCVYAIYASSMQQKGIFKISGDEITEFEKRQAAMQNREPVSTLERVEQLEQRRWQKQQQARYCGEGRVGHGTGTRVAPAYRDADKIARFRDTINHRYSKALVEYAEKNGFGTIQMEDLSGIKEDTGFPKRLRHWTYFDLQTKIQYKAAERGITVVKIDPQYTSQRCSRCGYIDKANRASQEKFLCQSCGFEANADYNASQNISVEKIDKLIAKDKKKLART